MKTLSKLTIMILLLMSEANAFSATCEATNGWTAVTTPLEIGATRVPGNTMVSVYNDQNQHVLAFAAESKSVGFPPAAGVKDEYIIETVFQDQLGFEGFAWSTPWGCPRCTPDMLSLPSYIDIQSKEGSIQLVCEMVSLEL